MTWIDANGPYHDGFINKRLSALPYDLPTDGELARQIAVVHAKRCAGCHQPGEVSRLDWIDLSHPRQSRFLTAPLSKAASGTGKCSQPVYQDQQDPDYQALLQIVDAAAQKAWALPRRDLKGLHPSK